MNKLNGRNEEDRRVYERSARLILLLALRDVVPGAKVRFEHSIGHGIYMNVVGADVTASLVRRIEKRMHEIVAQDLPIPNPAGRARKRSLTLKRRGRRIPCACFPIARLTFLMYIPAMD